MEIIIIAAVSENGVIGKDNALPWRIKEDMARFKELTLGRPCVMGRKTWDSLPKKPLPGRLNIIISKTLADPQISARELGDSSLASLASWREIMAFPSLSSAIEFCTDYKKIFICGGESIYRQAMPLANKIDLTLIPGLYDGDTYFPEIDDTWEKTDTVNHDEFSVIIYQKKELK